MTTEYVDIRETMTVAQAMAHIKETGIHKETIYTCYVTDQRRLLGIVSAKDLMTTADDILIRDLMQTEIISVSTHTDKEEVAQLFTKYDFLALPVLDQDERLVGIVTFDDAMDVMVDEATEDITKMAAMSPSEKTYFETSVCCACKTSDRLAFDPDVFLLPSPERSLPDMKTLSPRSRFLYPSFPC